MGTILKVFFMGFAIIAGLGAGEIAAEEMKDRYRKSKKKDDVVTVEKEESDIKVEKE